MKEIKIKVIIKALRSVTTREYGPYRTIDDAKEIILQRAFIRDFIKDGSLIKNIIAQVIEKNPHGKDIKILYSEDCTNAIKVKKL